MENMKLTAVYVKGEFGYTAYIDELKGVITQGETIEEAEENLYDALRLYLEPDDVGGEMIQLSGSSITKKPFLAISKAV